MALLAIDSTGKTSKKAYCYTVCQQWHWLEPIYSPGACLVDLIEEVLGSGRRHDTLCIISNANKVVSMKWTEYLKTTREDVWKAVYQLAEHIQNMVVSKHLILFGADVGLFEGAPFPDDYRRIQQDILNMLSYMGLNAGTGMESIMVTLVDSKASWTEIGTFKVLTETKRRRFFKQFLPQRLRPHPHPH